MTDKMMRLAGRDGKGMAKAIKSNGKGELIINEKNTPTPSLLGNFVEPYESGYVGNVAVSGLEVFGKLSLLTEITSVKAGEDAIFVADASKKVKKFSGSFDDDVPMWIYSDFVGTTITAIALDGSGDVIISGTNTYGHRIIEKISGETGVFVWRNVYNRANYLSATDIFVDSNGNIYTVGSAGADSPNTVMLLRKHNGLDGALLWELAHTFTSPIWFNYLTLDCVGAIYVSNRVGLVKLDQSLASTAISPSVVWQYNKIHLDAYASELYINIDINGNIYRIEQTYTAGVRGHKLVKIDQSLANLTIEPVVVWSKNYPYSAATVKIQLDSEGYTYTDNGKTDSEGVDVWGSRTPLTMHDIRNDFLYGVRKTSGHNNELRYDVFKVGIDLKPKTCKGVK